jgi:uncharacterized protein YggE
MYRSGLITVTLLGFAIGVSSSRSVQAQMPAPERPASPQIMSSGHGEAHVSPDRATLLVTVETRGATAAAAGTDNATRQRATMDALRALGLQKNQLSTAGYNVQPEYNNSSGQSPRVTDYVARNTVRAELQQIDQVGRAIDAALGAGATTISGVQFWATNADSARRAALSAAVTQAREDADAMARAAGGTLGPLLELSATTETPTPRPMMPMVRAMGAGVASQAPTAIEPGDLTTNADVSGRWQFTPK